MGSTPDMGTTRRWGLKSSRWKPGIFKPRRKVMKVRGDVFREAQQHKEVKDFLDEALAKDEELHRKGLIHP